MGDHDDVEEFPDTVEYIPYITGSNIMQRNGEKVVCWGRIASISPNGDNFIIKTVDDQDITVRLRSPLSEPIEGWIEVHGVAQGKTINCNEFMLFPAEQTEDIDKDGHRGLVLLLGALDNPWNLGENEAHDGVSLME